MSEPYPATTFASDEDREVYELRRLAAHDTTLTDHETRIDTLESGGGGGLTETMYASAFGVEFTVPAGDGTTAAEDWSEGNTGGADPPTIDGTDPTLLTINADGYHLVRLTVDGQGTLVAGECVTVVLLLGRGLSAHTLQVPVHGVTAGSGTPFQQATATISARLKEGDTVSAIAHYNTSGAASVYAECALSRIGTALDPAPIGL